jgi:phosphate transport system permease protein
MREGALALGIPKWKSTVRIVLVASLPGTLTGILLAMMRAAGEAAPLLFTASGSPYYLQGLNGPTGALPLLIFSFAQEYSAPNWVKMAWGATLFLLVFVLTANVLSRVFIRRLERRMGRA